ncbi:MAG: long-chain fatty acid--CoA ligase [Desulfobacteraceae bacterium]|nr:long-chain fatty acid--CoA ligase [Desulfobacteraceae bacterium]
MKFVSQVSSSASSQKNILTDGKLTCTYEDISQIFEDIEKLFSERNIRVETPLVLECENTLHAALTVLYLLERDYSFLLIPKTDKTSREPGAEPLFPPFFRYWTATQDIEEDADFDPGKYLQIAENKAWSGHDIPCKRGKLYLRTSGSTGAPKMAVHNLDRLRGNARNCVERLDINRDDRIAVPVPIFHMFGLGAAFLPAVAVEASVDLQKGANLLTYMQRERVFNPSVAFMTPVFCETLLKGRKSPRTYRLTVTAGDRFRKDGAFAKYESLFGCLVNLYGSTEMGAITAGSPDDSFEDRSGTAGKPMTGALMRAEKRNPKSGNGNDIGELLCRYEYGFEGYADENGNPADGNQEWFRTKDLGRIRPDGRIEVMGRCDHSVNRDGLLVFFADVERAVKTINGIDSVVIVSQGESRRGKGIVAYCVPIKETDISETDVRNACFGILPGRAVPDTVIFKDSLPLLPSGKIDRQKLALFHK